MKPMTQPTATKKHPAELTLTILGCGTSTGVPLISCTCRVCRSRNPKNKRLRASAWVQTQGKSLLIDTSTDFRQQALRERIPRVDAVLYTHPHADHVYGIDDLRSYNFIQKQSIPVYGNQWTEEDLTGRFSYIFRPAAVIEGGGAPRLDFHRIDGHASSIDIQGIKVIPLSLRHGSKECLGYRINSVAYVTDCHYIPRETLDRMRNLSVLVLDCLRISPHGTHLNLEKALEIVSEVRPRKTYLTHLGHDFDYATWKTRLPKGVHLAYDGMRINVRDPN